MDHRVGAGDDLLSIALEPIDPLKYGTLRGARGSQDLLDPNGSVGGIDQSEVGECPTDIDAQSDPLLHQAAP